jgi:hypothetical protein
MAKDRPERGLADALAERDRLTQRFQRAIGTELEQSAYMRLRAASARVAVASRRAADSEPRAPFPTRAQPN